MVLTETLRNQCLLHTPLLSSSVLTPSIALYNGSIRSLASIYMPPSSEAGETDGGVPLDTSSLHSTNNNLPGQAFANGSAGRNADYEAKTRHSRIEWNQIDETSSVAVTDDVQEKMATRYWDPRSRFYNPNDFIDHDLGAYKCPFPACR